MLLFPSSYGHNAFAFQSQLNADGSRATYANNFTTTQLTERLVRVAFRDVRDPYHLTQGGTLGRSHKGFKTIQLAGIIKGPDASQNGSVSDRERELLAAFDPALCIRDSPSTQGAYPFTFSERTLDTTTYPTGIVPLQYWCRPADHPTMRETSGESGVRTFALELIAADPRLYEQTEQTLALSSGTPSGNVVNRGTVPAPLKATIVTSGVGGSFTITRAGVSFVLDLSAVAAGTIVVIFETCAPYGTGRSITRSGASIFGKKTSNAATWLDVPVGTTLFTISNLTGITSVTLGWYSARA